VNWIDDGWHLWRVISIAEVSHPAPRHEGLCGWSAWWVDSAPWCDDRWRGNTFDPAWAL